MIRANMILDLQPNIPVTDAWKLSKRKDAHRVTTEDSEKLGGLYRMKLGFLNVLVASDPWIIAELQDRQKYPDLVDKPQEPFMYPVLNPWSSRPARPNAVSAMTADPVWRAVHRATSHSFSMQNVRDAFSRALFVVGRLTKTIQKLGSGANVDLEAAVQCLVLDVSSRVAFDLDPKATTDLHGEGAKIADYITQGASLAVQWVS
eukprot:jgi/Botrbrau1/22079/Bobra.0206s0007.1